MAKQLNWSYEQKEQYTKELETALKLVKPISLFHMVPDTPCQAFFISLLQGR